MNLRKESWSLGRPRKIRSAKAGEKLRMALLLLKKSWGSNVNEPNHIFNMKRWDVCGLPRSVKTVKEDIRHGMALDRIANYASLLNISPDVLTDEAMGHTDSKFISAIVQAKSDVLPPSIMMYNIFGGQVNEKFVDFNRVEYLKELFTLVQGFYVMYLAKVPFQFGINKMVYAIYESDAYYLRTRANFYLETERHTLTGEVHRWGEFLYCNQYTPSLQSFGMAILPEPTRPAAIVGRKPFYMTGKYLFGAEAFGREPIFAAFHMERRQDLPAENWEEAFEEFAQANLSYQFLFAEDPEHDYAMSRLRRALDGRLGEG